MRVRRAVGQDVEQVAEIFPVVLEAFGEVDPGHQALVAFVEALVEGQGRGCVLLAEDDGGIVGVLTLAWSLTSKGPGLFAYLDDLYVAPQHRRGKVASELLRHAVAEARSAGASEIRLAADLDLPGLQRLYLDAGFELQPMSWLVHTLDETSR